MKKLFAFVILSLFITSCTQQNRNEEYVCKFLSGKKKHDDVTLEILKDQVNLQFSDGSKYNYSILEEKSDRIIFGHKPKDENNMKQTFYKKTKKYRFDSSWKKTKHFFSVIYECQRLN